MTPGRVLVDLASALFAEWCGEPPSDIRPVAADGSTRSYWRLTAPDGASAVGAHGPDPNENRAFLSFSRTLRELGLPVPEVYGADEGAGVWLLEDLGDTTLFDAIKEAREPGSDAFPDAALPLYRRVLEILPRFQVEGGERINFRRAYPRAAFDRQSILWDLNYFKYHFLKLARIPFNEARLERDFSRLAAHLLGAGRSWFLYRDLQSRNVMVRPGPEGPEPWFIDYQGGRRGALQYDVASLLYDSKANLDARHRETLLDYYLGVLEARGVAGRDEFLEGWPGYVLVRVLQALGAYGYRGFFERKPRFLQSVPYAAENLRGLLEAGLPVDVPELEGALGAIVDRWSRAEGPVRDGRGTRGHDLELPFLGRISGGHLGPRRGTRVRLPGTPQPGTRGGIPRTHGARRGDDRVHRGAAGGAGVLGAGARGRGLTHRELRGARFPQPEREFRVHGGTAPFGVHGRAPPRAHPRAPSRRPREPHAPGVGGLAAPPGAGLSAVRLRCVHDLCKIAGHDRLLSSRRVQPPTLADQSTRDIPGRRRGPPHLHPRSTLVGAVRYRSDDPSLRRLAPRDARLPSRFSPHDGPSNQKRPEAIWNPEASASACRSPNLGSFDFDSSLSTRFTPGPG